MIYNTVKWYNAISRESFRIFETLNERGTSNVVTCNALLPTVLDSSVATRLTLVAPRDPVLCVFSRVKREKEREVR